MRTSKCGAFLVAFFLAAMAGCEEKISSGDDSGIPVTTCADRLDCPGRLGCRDGVCGRCERNRDCLVTEFCHPIDRLCSPRFEGDCRLNEDCPLSNFCVQGTCKASGDVILCTKNANCALGERCDLLNLVCVLDLGCNRDEDCQAQEVCDLARNRCQSACTPETAEVLCGFGFVCDEFGRCVECFDDSQCGLGRRCNLELSRCEGENSCVTDRDCIPGTICNPQTRQCTVVPLDCLSTADCPTGAVCDPPTGRCVSAECRPDSLEPNDTPEQASTLRQGRTADYSLCPGDRDYFRIGLTRGDRLQVIVTTDFLAADRFQVVLLDPAASEVLAEGSLLLDQVVAKDGGFLLRAQTRDPEATYSFLITVSRGIPCDDDPLEQNDSAQSARPLVAGQYGPLALCPHDEDWYVVLRPLDKILEVRLDYPPLEGDLDLDLLSGDGQRLVMRSATPGPELVRAEDEPGTRFYVRVFADPQIGNRYQLSVALLPKSTGGAK